jgi:hypothetical protein
MPTELDQFLKSTEDDPNHVDVLDQPLVPEESEPGTEDPEGEGEPKDPEEGTGEPEEAGEGDDPKPEDFKPRNRRERRLRASLDAERQSSSELAAKLAAKTEAEQAIESKDYLKAVERIYGTDSPEAAAATQILVDALKGLREDAVNTAYSRMQEERQAELRAEREAQSQLDSFIDEIEETNNVSLTEAQEKGYVALLQKMSAKDRDGKITSYADPHAVWEIFKERTTKQPTNTRAKKLSSRSMTKTPPKDDTGAQENAAERFLKENGII